MANGVKQSHVDGDSVKQSHVGGDCVKQLSSRLTVQCSVTQVSKRLTVNCEVVVPGWLTVGSSWPH